MKVHVSARPPRFAVGSHRVHHGLSGIILGLACVLHDRRDWRRWIADLKSWE